MTASNHKGPVSALPGTEANAGSSSEQGSVSSGSTRPPRLGILGSEDWWAVWIGLGIVVLALILWVGGGSLNIFAAKIPSWPDWAFLLHGGTTLKDGETVAVAGLVERLPNLVLLYLLYTAAFGVVALALRLRLAAFIGGFTLLFVFSLVINVLSSSAWATSYNFEAPLVALVIGLVIGNLVDVERYFGGALRTELYVKVGIVLLGATLPFTVILQAGPVALLQASAIAIATFLIIFFVAVKLFGIDKRFAATLSAGGSICGVSASIAVGSAVKARKEHVSATISIVVVWSIIAIFVLTGLSKVFGLADGVAGAWIGTSEFADAAGITAASSFGDDGIAAFTLIKVVGRDIFIGVWSLILAIIAIAVWDRRDRVAAARAAGEDDREVVHERADVAQIWRRFPKFVLGFFVASILLTVVIAASGSSAGDVISSDVVAPIKELRTWAFTFTFLSIGLTTRFRALSSLGWRPVAAFSVGAVINIVLGFLISALVFGHVWANIGAGS